MQNGWIKLHRELLEKPIWTASTPEQKTILITLLAMANHKEKEWEWKGHKYVAKPGQFVTSLPSIVEKSGKGISVQNVRTALKRFEKLEFLTDESTKQNRLITLLNWGLYQHTEGDLTDDLTVSQQTTNSQLTANKNVRRKEGKKRESSPKQVYDETSDFYILASFMYEQILKNNPNHKQPNLQGWSNDFRLMMETDKRDKKEIARLVKWVQQDDFEMSNVLSPSKLRKRYDQLKMKMDKLPQVGQATNKASYVPLQIDMNAGEE